MRVVHVLRKPCSEGTVASNVLKYGCGGLNIDATRIKASGDEKIGPGSWSNPANRSGVVGTDLGITRTNRTSFQEAQQASTERANNLGRWPANLILEHREGCVQAGTKRVKASQSSRPGSGIGHEATEGHGIYHGVGGVVKASTADSEGMETIAAWNCQPGCPIPDLDGQSGISKSTGGRAYQNTNDMYSGGWAHKGKGVAVNPGFGDVGAASRFFKQVQK